MLADQQMTNDVVSFAAEPPTYVESYTGAVDIRDEDDYSQGTMGDLTYTPLYRYVYDYRYRPPPAYCEVQFTCSFSGPSAWQKSQFVVDSMFVVSPTDLRDVCDNVDFEACLQVDPFPGTGSNTSCSRL